MTTAGPIPSSAGQLNNDLIASVQAVNPDFTANLPGTLIEDLTSTGTAALAQVDQARVDAVNSVTPYGANAYILAAIGQQLGLPIGTPTNTNVLVVFACPASPGLVIPPGFIISDGNYSYVIQDGGVIESNGQSAPMLAVAQQAGTWAVPANTVTQIATSLASPFNTTLTVTNPQAGTPAQASETVQSYRSRIMQAQKVAVQGVAAYVTTLLQAVPGVTPRLVSVLQTSLGWEVLCGGGDPYAVAFAIYQAVLDLSTITGSLTASRNVPVTIMEGPNQYTLTYVNPPQQIVTVDIIWNTDLPNFTGGAQVSQFGAQAVMNYINSVTVGQPLNINSMNAAFVDAVSGNSVPALIDEDNIAAISMAVFVNGVEVTPETGTFLIPGDAESYFYCAANGVTAQQG